MLKELLLCTTSSDKHSSYARLGLADILSPPGDALAHQKRKQNMAPLPYGIHSEDERILIIVLMFITKANVELRKGYLYPENNVYSLL